MDFRRLRDLLLPDSQNQDVQFLSEVRRLSHEAVRIMGWTEIALAAFVFLARMVTETLVTGRSATSEAPLTARAWQAALVVLVAALTLWAAQTQAGRRRPALFLCLSGWISSVVVIASSLVLMPHSSDEYITVHITTILLVAITVCPLRPLDTFVLGGSIWVAYLTAFVGGALGGGLDWNTWHPSHLAFLLLLILLAVAFAASSWGALRALPQHLEAVPLGIVALIMLFGAYVWRKKSEIAELHGFIHGLQQGAAVPATQQQFAQLLELVSRSQHGYREMIDSLDHLVFSLSLSGEIQLVNRRFIEILGLGFADVIHHPFEEFLSEPSLADVEKGIPRFLEKRCWSGVVKVRLRKTGETRYFDCVLHAVVKDDVVAGVSGLAHDVTAQRENEARFQKLFETLQEGVYLSTPEGKILEANPALIRMLGYGSKEELLAVNAADLHPDPDQRSQLLAEIEEKGPLRNREIVLRRKDGALIHCINSATPVRDTSGRIARLQGTIVDITERRKMEKQLRQEQEFVRRLVESFPDVIVVMDIQGQYTFVSPRIRDISGYEPEELLGQHLGQLSHPEDQLALRKVFQNLITGKAPFEQIEYRTMRKDGIWRTFRANACPLYDGDGKISGVVASARDVTESKRLEQQLIQAEKLAAVGQMIAGVAHELNNPLTAILGVSDLLRERASDDVFRRQTDLIHQQARRAAQIVQSLLAFSRPPTTSRSQVNISDIVERALQLHEHSLQKNRIAVEFHRNPSLVPVQGDANQLLQVFLNLVTNAEQAIHEIRESGKLCVRVGSGDEKTWVEFEDDGPGVPPAILPKVFDPFFTTKRPGGGTGLGLTICLSIVRDHSGTIEIHSAKEEGGAIFRVVLPAAREEGTRASPTTRKILQGHAVLVVEDEEGIRELVQESLLSKGLSVDSVAGPEEALARLASRSYDAILCDYNLPGMTGQQFFEKIQTQLGGAAPRFIFMTGELLESPLLESFKQRGARMLMKPFHMSDLMTILLDVLQPVSAKSH
jgi:PAS domain S-box-containing protein